MLLKNYNLFLFRKKHFNFFKKIIVKKLIFTSFYKEVTFFKNKFILKSFSINGLDRKLEKYLNKQNGFYVELGANDGIAQSNSLYFELYKNWRGVLVEPSPKEFLFLKKKRYKKFHLQ